MRAVATRTVSITTSPTSIRGTNLLPVAYTVMRYTGATGVELVPASDSTYGQGQAVTADTDFQDNDQSIVRYAIAASGTVSLRVTDFQT